MLIITQQLVDEEQRTWQDVAVPHDVYTIEDWQERLRRHGMAGVYRAVETDYDDDDEEHPTVLCNHAEFKIIETRAHEILDLKIE